MFPKNSHSAETNPLNVSNLNKNAEKNGNINLAFCRSLFNFYEQFKRIEKKKQKKTVKDSRFFMKRQPNAADALNFFNHWFLGVINFTELNKKRLPFCTGIFCSCNRLTIET